MNLQIPEAESLSVENWREVAEVLKPLAKARRGIQKQLALRLGLSEGLVSRYITGDTVPDPVVAVRICAALGVSLDELAGITDRRPNVEEIAAKLEELAASLRRK